MDLSEHDKLKEIQDKSQAIGEFLDWCRWEKGWSLHDGDRNVASYNIEELLGEYFEIDLKKIEEEKRAILTMQRIRNNLADNHA